jgi:cytochrome c oxidase subunit 6b
LVFFFICLQAIFSTDVEVSDEQKAAMDVIKNVRTTARDSRFPTQNQANNCWNKYNEWLLCLKNTGDEDGCKNMRQKALSICPSIWSEKWDEEREEGTFPGLKV